MDETGRNTHREGFEAKPCGIEAKPCGIDSKTSGFVLKPIRFASSACGLRLFPHGFEPELIGIDVRGDASGSFPYGNKSFPHGDTPLAHSFDLFRCRFKPATIRCRPLTIGFLPETSNFTAFRYCSAPDPCVLAADPSFFVPDRCGSGVEKTVLSQLTRRPTAIDDEARTGDEGRGR